jgi:hypothetical protein
MAADSLIKYVKADANAKFKNSYLIYIVQTIFIQATWARAYIRNVRPNERMVSSANSICPKVPLAMLRSRLGDCCHKIIDAVAYEGHPVIYAVRSSLYAIYHFVQKVGSRTGPERTKGREHLQQTRHL